MKDIIKALLSIIEDRYFELDNMILLSDRDESYVLEYEYLRGKRDALLYLLSIVKEEEDEDADDYPFDIINKF